MPTIGEYEYRKLHPFWCIVVGRLLPLIFIIPGGFALFGGAVELLSLGEHFGWEGSLQPEAPYFAVVIGALVFSGGCYLWYRFGENLFEIKAKSWRFYDF